MYYVIFAFLQNLKKIESIEFYFSFVHKFRLREKSADDNNNDQSTTSKRKEYDCLCIASRNLETVRK